MSDNNAASVQGNSDKPTFTIYSEGKEVTKAYQLQSIVISREVNRVASAILIFFDGDPAKESFRISNSNEFIPGNEIEIHVGYHADEKLIFKGIIVNHGLRARQNKSSIIRILCKDEAVKLTV
jgi:phage protein D